MHFSLTEQVALITGGNSGIGLCTVKRFLEAGARVVVADLAPECTLEAQPNLLYRQCDVTQEGQVKAAMEEAVTAFDSLTVVVNNAGTFSNYNAIQDKSANDFLRCHQVNLMGALHAMKYCGQTHDWRWEYCEHGLRCGIDAWWAYPTTLRPSTRW